MTNVTLIPMLGPFGGDQLIAAMRWSIKCLLRACRPVPIFTASLMTRRILCDVLSSFAPGAKASLHELCRVMGLPGKPDAINGSEVDRYFREDRIREIADYCESDVVNTYRVWLRHELFQGNLSDAAFEASETNLSEFTTARSNAKPI
jgi:predicted PolB exonuclease-like 3'-5' exonuclease